MNFADIIKAGAAERLAERAKAYADYLPVVIAKYGSEEAAKAPDDRERAVEKAAAPLMRKVLVEYHGQGAFWTDSLDGCRFTITDRLSDRAAEVIREAIPFPTTICEAKAEHDYWRQRDDELKAVHGYPSCDTMLSLPCEARQHLIWEALSTGLRAVSLADAIVRHRWALEDGFHDGSVAAAMLADLEHLLQS